MKYHIKINNDDSIGYIYNDLWQVNGSNLEKQQGARVIQVPLSELQELLFDDSLKSRASSKSNYVVESGVARLKTDDELYEDNKPRLKAQKKQELYEAMAKTTVEINGKVFWADPGSEQNFQGRIREMELNGKQETKWAQGFDIFIATLDELKYVVAEGTKKNAALWDKYISELEAI